MPPLTPSPGSQLVTLMIFWIIKKILATILLTTIVCLSSIIFYISATCWTLATMVLISLGPIKGTLDLSREDQIRLFATPTSNFCLKKPRFSTSPGLHRITTPSSLIPCPPPLTETTAPSTQKPSSLMTHPSQTSSKMLGTPSQIT